jgi:hypothetical protein
MGASKSVLPIEEFGTPRSFSVGMGEAGGFEGFDLWWREQVPRLTGAYLPLLAARLGGGMAEDAPAVRLWRSRVLPELRAVAALTVDDFERRLGRSVALSGIDVVTGTVGVGAPDQRRAG